MVYLGYMIPSNEKIEQFFNEESKNLEISYEKLLEILITDYLKFNYGVEKNGGT